MAKKPPTSVFKRSTKLLGMAAKVASKEIGSRVANKLSQKVDDLAPAQVKARIDQAKAITQTLSQLKGAAMKAGQMLSIDASEFLPEEAREILSQLQSEAEPADFSVIEGVLKKELSPEKLEQLKSLEKTPYASASIGQVHRAKLGGESVVLKVQYPGVDKSIDSDLKLLRQVAQSFVSLSGRKVDLAETFEEFATVLKWETDYKREAHYLQKFYDITSDLPQFIVPKLHPEFSTQKVLCMGEVPGLSLGNWLKTNPPMEQREKLGHLVLDLFCREFLDWGMVQTDPNFANFMIKPETDQLVLLDFGATIEYDLEFRQGYGKVLLDLASGDANRIYQSVVEFGLLQDNESQAAKEAFRDMLMVSLEPMKPETQPFEFASIDYERRARNTALKFTKELKHSAPPRKILFLHRKLGGIFNLLKQMEVRLDLVEYWERMTSSQKSPLHHA